jgi:hypothetical protein
LIKNIKFAEKQKAERQKDKQKTFGTEFDD